MPRTKKTKAMADKPQTTAQSLGSLIKSARDIMRKDKGLNGDLDRLPMLTWIMFLKFLDDLEMQRKDEADLAGTKFRPAVEKPYRWRDWAAQADGITGDELLAFINQDKCRRPDGTKGAGLFAYLRNLTSSNGDNRRDVIATVFKGVDNRMKSGYLLRDVINKVNGIHFTASDELHTLGSLYESMLREMRDAAGDSGEFYTPRAVVRFMVEAVNPRLGETVLDPACGTGGFLVEVFSHLSQQVKTVADRKLLQTRSVSGYEAKPLPYLLAQMNLLLHGLDAPQIDPGNALRFKLTEIGEKERVNVILTNPPFGGEEEKGIQGNFPEDRQTAETALLFLQLIMRRLKRDNTKEGKTGRAGVVVPESVMGDLGVAQRIRSELVDQYNLHTVIRLPKGVFEPYSDIQTNILFFDRSSTTQGIWFYQHEVPIERRGMRNPCYTRTYSLRYDELVPIREWWDRRQVTEHAWYVPKEEIVRRNYSFDFRNPNYQGTDFAGPSAVVSAMRGPLERATQSLSTLLEQKSLLESLSSGPWEKMSLSSFLVRVRHEAILDQETEYKQITVKLYGKGVILRKVLRGDAIRTRPQFSAKVGQLIMSRIDARNGAFGIVPVDLDGAVVTQDFPLFDVDREVVEPAFLALLLRSEGFVSACKHASRGTTNRKRLKEELFLQEKVPIPPKPVQLAATQLVTAIESIVRDANSASAVADSVVPAIANYIFE